jgi:hypothetical protein
MLNATEAGLTAAQYTDIQEFKKFPAYSILLERYNLSFSQAGDESRTVAGTDAAVNATYLIRAYYASGNLYIETSTDGATWTNRHTDSSDVDHTVPPSLFVTGTTVVCFYYTDAGVIAYVTSSDSGETFGSEQTVGSQSNVEFLAAVSAAKVHVFSHDAPNGRLHYWENDGGWSQTDSAIYWPHLITGFDAITIGSKDLLVFSTLLQTRYGSTRQGIVGMWQANSRWSEHWAIDVVDESETWLYRKWPRLTTNSTLYFLTYYGSDGTEDYPIADRMISRSKNGDYWERPTYSVCSESGAASLLVLDNDAYVVGTGITFISDATRFVGYSPGSGDAAYFGDLTPFVVKGFRSEMGKMRQTTLTLGDEARTLESNWFSGTSTLLLDIDLGWQDEGTALRVPYSIEEVDYARIVDTPNIQDVQISSRDRLAWLFDDTRATDHYKEWLSQLLGRDVFRDETDTGYGGLRHTATDGGYFETENDRLKLKTTNETRQAHNTFTTKMGNGVIRSGVLFATAANDEIVGLTFRCEDWDNYFRLAYENNDDKIHLRRVVDSVVGGSLVSTSALSWSADTDYYLMVKFRYKHITAYYSTDGVTWTQAFAYEDDSSRAHAAEMIEGYVGYIGYGFSDEDEDGYDYDPPGDWGYWDPWPPEEFGQTGALLSGDGSEGVWYLPPNAGTWLERDGTLTGGNDDTEQLGWDPWWFTPQKQNSSDPERAITWRCHVGKLYRSDDNGLTWADKTPSTDPPNDWGDVTAPTVADVTFVQRIDSIYDKDLHIWIAAWQETDSGDLKWRSWFLKTTDDGETYTWYSIQGEMVNIGWFHVQSLHDFDDSEDPARITLTDGENAYGDHPPPYYDGDYATFRNSSDNKTGRWDMDLGRSIPDVTQIRGYLSFFTFPSGHWPDVYFEGSPDASVWTNFGILSSESTSWKWHTEDNAAITIRYVRVRCKSGSNVFHYGRGIYADSFQVYSTGESITDTEYRLLWADLDSESGDYLWCTAYRDGHLYIQRRLVSDLSCDRETDLGEATEAEVDAKAWIAYPMTPFGDASKCYVFGRMDAPASLSGTQHIIKTTDAASTFSSVESGWSTDYCSAFRAGQPLDDQDTLIAIRRKSGGGSTVYYGLAGASIASIGDVSIQVNVDGLTVSNTGDIGIASDAAGSIMVMVIHPPYNTWLDITFNHPATGAVNSLVYL